MILVLRINYYLLCQKSLEIAIQYVNTNKFSVCLCEIHAIYHVACIAHINMWIYCGVPLSFIQLWPTHRFVLNTNYLCAIRL